MQYLSSIFGSKQSSAETPLKSEQRKPSILAVEDVLAETVDEKAKKVIGSMDQRTDPFNGNWSEAPFKQKWTCRYKNFFLGETKYSHYEDGNGNRINSNYIDSSGNEQWGIWYSDIVNEEDRLLPPKWHDQANFLLLKEKKLSDGKILRKFVTKTPGKEYSGIRKVAKYGFTLSDRDASYLKINQQPGERYFNAFRVVHEGPISEGQLIPWQKVPGFYENPDDLVNYREFCQVCNIGRVVYPPSSSPSTEIQEKRKEPTGRINQYIDSFLKKFNENSDHFSN